MRPGDERLQRTERAAPKAPRAPRVPVELAPRGAAGEVRIIGGQWKRTKLPVADVAGLRPTPDRVRETLFNWLGQDLSGWRCLDAFAGTGALGFEAASRGAAEEQLVEREAKLVASLEQAKSRLKADAVSIVRSDALSYMASAGPGRYDLVFIDPPFAADLFDAAVRAAVRVVVPGGYVYLEAGKAFGVEELAGTGLEVFRHARAGAVHAHLLRKAASDG